MRYSLLLLVFGMAIVGCDLKRSAVAPTPITITNTLNNTNNASGGSDVDVPELTTANVLNLDPNAITVEVDRRVAVTVSATTPGGQNIPAGDISVTILDPSVVMLSEVIGERAFFRGVNVGETSVVVHAVGATATLSVSVIPQP